MPVPYEELSNVARTVLVVSVGAFAAGELGQALRVRRGATLVSLRAEAVFRAVFFSAILLLPIGRAIVVKTSDDQPVVQRGPYRVLRHPSYTGLLLAFAGVGLMLDRCRDFAASRARLIPYVW